MTYRRKAKPRFEVGDLVVSFRGERGTVIEVTSSPDWTVKSHRVSVKWTDKDSHRYSMGLYEEVFEFDHYGDDPVMEMNGE
jgi:hypothetical protein